MSTIKDTNEMRIALIVQIDNLLSIAERGTWTDDIEERNYVRGMIDHVKAAVSEYRTRPAAIKDAPALEAVPVYFARHPTARDPNEWTQVATDKFQVFIDSGFVTRTLYTAPAKQEAAPLEWPKEWQPMETAPRDGTYILLGNRCGAWIGRYKSEYTSGWKPANPWQCMMLNTEHLTKPGSIVPNYWMPLTAAPIATKQSPAAPTDAKESTS